MGLLIDRVSLELIVLTGELGAISAAARRVRLSPSLATRKIAAVEQALGVRLFVRTTKSSLSTEAGSHVIEWARGVLRDEALMRDRLSEMRREVSGSIRFACPEFLMSAWLTGFIADFGRRYPQVTLSVLTVDRPVQVAEERYDVALHLGDEPSGDLVGRRLHDVTTYLYATHAYVEEFGRPRTPADLAGHRLIRHALFDEENWYLRDRHGAIVTVPLHSAFECSSALTTLEMMMHNSGILKASPRTMLLPRFREAVTQILPGYECVLSDGGRWGVWLLFPDRMPAPRIRVFADQLTSYIQAHVPQVKLPEGAK